MQVSVHDELMIKREIKVRYYCVHLEKPGFSWTLKVGRKLD